MEVAGGVRHVQRKGGERLTRYGDGGCGGATNEGVQLARSSAFAVILFILIPLIGA